MGEGENITCSPRPIWREGQAFFRVVCTRVIKGVMCSSNQPIPQPLYLDSHESCREIGETPSSQAWAVYLGLS